MPGSAHNPSAQIGHGTVKCDTPALPLVATLLALQRAQGKEWLSTDPSETKGGPSWSSWGHRVMLGECVPQRKSHPKGHDST